MQCDNCLNPAVQYLYFHMFDAVIYHLNMFNLFIVIFYILLKYIILYYIIFTEVALKPQYLPLASLGNVRPLVKRVFFWVWFWSTDRNSLTSALHILTILS